jgi:3-hydroxymyristoyl/3-hydroxydecanoyl-(acyl carrier protein) dehydratase
MSAGTSHSAGAWLYFERDHPALAGHFPQRPIVPGVVLLDETLHTLEQALATQRSPEVRHWHIANVKFHHLVTPGQRLRLEWRCESPGEIPGETARVGQRVRVALKIGQRLIMSAALERRDP